MPPKWLLYSLLTILAWGVWALLAVPLGHLSAPQSQAFSTVGVLPLMVAAGLSAWRGRPERDRQRALRGSLWAFAAGVVSGLGNLGYYKALSVGAKASVAVSLTALYPLTTIAIAFLVLRERPGKAQGAGILGALMAIYLLNVGEASGEGGAGLLSPWSLYALAPVLLWGLAAALSKVAAGHVSPEVAVFWYLAASWPLAMGLVAVEPMTWGLSPREWALLALLGFTLGVGNLTVLAAYRAAGKASVVTPLAGLYPVISIPLAIALYHEEVRARQWIGIGVALVAMVGLVREPRATASHTAPPPPLSQGAKSP